MTPKELSVWDVINGVSEEDAKQDDNIVFAKARRIVTMPCSNTSVNANGTAFVPSELNRSLRDFNTAVGGVPLLREEEPWGDNIALQEEDGLEYLSNARAVLRDPNTGRPTPVPPRYTLYVYSNNRYVVCEEMSGLCCDISPERLLYEDTLPSACRTPRGGLLRFADVVAIAQPH